MALHFQQSNLTLQKRGSALFLYRPECVWVERQNVFLGKAVPKHQSSVCFGSVKTLATHPCRSHSHAMSSSLPQRFHVNLARMKFLRLVSVFSISGVLGGHG